MIKELHKFVCVWKFLVDDKIGGLTLTDKPCLEQTMFDINPHETARYGEIASAILNFFVCCMEMG